jgi:hypothetical protein
VPLYRVPEDCGGDSERRRWGKVETPLGGFGLLVPEYNDPWDGFFSTGEYWFQEE